MKSDTTVRTPRLSLADTPSLIGRTFDVDVNGTKSCGVIVDIFIEAVGIEESVIITVEQPPMCTHGGFVVDAPRSTGVKPTKDYVVDKFAQIHDHPDGSIRIWIPLVWRGTINPM